jgi:Protein of unknown function (DUF3592)
MKLRALFDPGALAPYRPPSIALSIAAILLGVLLCIPQISSFLEYRELRYGTVMTTGIVENIVNSVNDAGKRSYLQSRVIYVFFTPDGVRRRGDFTRPAVQVEHLKRGSKVQVYYKLSDPARNTTADDLHMRLWWGLVPASALAVFWFSLQAIFILQAFRRLHQNEIKVADTSA